MNEPRGACRGRRRRRCRRRRHRMALAVCWMALDAVAQALNTLVKGMPVRPRSPVSGSVCATSQLPPKANWTSGQVDAGVLERELDGIGAHVERGLVAETTEGVQADPDDGNVLSSSVSSVALGRAVGDGREREGHDLVPVGVDVEGDDRPARRPCRSGAWRGRSRSGVLRRARDSPAARVPREGNEARLITGVGRFERTTSSSCTSPTPKGVKLLPVSSPRRARSAGSSGWSRPRASHGGGAGARPCRCGRSGGSVTGAGTVAAQLSQRLPMSWAGLKQAR